MSLQYPIIGWMLMDAANECNVCENRVACETKNERSSMLKSVKMPFDDSTIIINILKILFIQVMTMYLLSSHSQIVSIFYQCEKK